MNWEEKLDAIRFHYEDALRARQTDGWTLYLYGAGIYGRKMFSMLQKQGIAIASFVVTEKKYNLLEVMGLPVQTLDEVAAGTRKPCFLLAVKPASEELLIRELEKRGISDYLCLPEYAEEILDDTFFRPVMEITPRAGCSVNCRFCPQTLFLKQYFSGGGSCPHEMTIGEFRRYVRALPKDCMIDFSGFVEPFLAKDGLEMVKYAYASGHDVRLFTTLQGLTLEQFHEIEDIPFKLVVLHLPDKNGYANIPVTPEYLQLLQYVAGKKRTDGRPFVDTANCQCEPHPETVNVIQHRIPISWDLIDRAGNLDDASLRSAQEKHEPIYCGRAAAYNHNVLLPNGDVVLCCMDFGMQRVLGNLNHSSYAEIMQGEPMRRIQQANRNCGDLLCRKCTYAKPLSQ